MPFSTAYFYGGPFTAATITPVYPDDDSGYVIHTAEKVKHTRDVNQTIKVPYFDAYDEVTMVRIDDDYYWIDGYSDITIGDEIIEFRIRYSPVTSLLRPGDSLNAEWIRFPEKRLSNPMQCDMINDTFIETRVDLLRTLDHTVDDTVYQFLWVEIITSCKLGRYPVDWVNKRISYCDITTDPVYSGNVVDQSRMSKYGFFVAVGPDHDATALNIPVYAIGGTADDDANMYDVGASAVNNRNQSLAYYPSIYDVINNFTPSLGIPSDAVMDISISPWCPYKVRFHDRSGIMDGAPWSEAVPFISEDGEHDITPSVARWTEDVIASFGTPSASLADQRFIVFYDLGAVGGEEYESDAWDDHVLAIDELEHSCGRIEIRDGNGATVAEIPASYFVYDDTEVGEYKYKFGYQAKTFSDSTGLYTRIRWGDGRHEVTLMEGKLPTISDSWKDYSIRSMATDRQALQNAKDQALLNFAGNVAGSIGDAITGGIYAQAMNWRGKDARKGGGLAAGGATLAGGIASGAISTFLEIDAADRERELKEKEVANQPSTGFQTSYGTMYIDRCRNPGAGFFILLPKDMTYAKYHSYIACHGYPDELIGIYNISTGAHQDHMQCVLHDLTRDGGAQPLNNGLKMQMLATILMQGVTVQFLS